MAEHEFVISKMVRGDIESVLELGFSAHDLVNDPHAEHLYSERRLEILVDRPHSILCVAKVEGELAGFSISAFYSDYVDGEIRVMQIAPAHRNKGAEDGLLNQTIAEFKRLGCERLLSWERPGSEGLGFLLRRNFSPGRSFFNLEYDLRSA